MEHSDSIEGNTYKLYCLAIFKWDETKPICLVKGFKLKWLSNMINGESYFLNEISSIVKKIPPGTKIAIDIKDSVGQVCFCFVEVSKDKVAAVAVTDDKYPDEVAYLGINKLLMNFREHFDENSDLYMEATESTKLEYPKLAELLVLWQNPLKVDPTVRITEDLRKTVAIQHKNLADLLERDGKIDEMGVKAKALNIQTNEFYKKAKKVNKKPWYSLCIGCGAK